MNGQQVQVTLDFTGDVSQLSTLVALHDSREVPLACKMDLQSAISNVTHLITQKALMQKELLKAANTRPGAAA